MDKGDKLAATVRDLGAELVALRLAVVLLLAERVGADVDPGNEFLAIADTLTDLLSRSERTGGYRGEVSFKKVRAEIEALVGMAQRSMLGPKTES